MFERISIRTNLLIIFLIIISLVTSVLISIQYHFSNQLAHSAAEETFRQVAQKMSLFIQERASQQGKSLKMIARQSHLLPADSSESHPLVNGLLSSVLANSPSLYSAYIGRDNGDFYQLINLELDASISEEYAAPAQSMWLLVRVEGRADGRIKTLEFLDEALTSISLRKVETQYDPRLRPWYKLALESDEVVGTSPYWFAGINSAGISYATKLRDETGVVAVDMPMHSLNEFLATQKPAQIVETFLYDASGFKYASSGKVNPFSSLEMKPLVDEKAGLQNDGVHTSPPEGASDYLVGSALLNDMINRGGELIKYEENGVEKLAYATQLPGFSSDDQYIGMTANVSVLTTPYMKQVNYSLYASSVMVVIAVLLALYATKRIVNPVNQLMVENRKIGARQYKDVRKINSNISEYISLSESMITMSESINAYEKSQQELMESIILLIADAIDAKSPYTGGHCNRVPEIAMKLAKVASDSREGEFADFCFTTEEEWREFRIGAWLHDCGKVVTPEYVVDKATKLETVYNRIHEVRTRFEVLWRDLEIAALKQQLDGDKPDEIHQWLEQEQQRLVKEFEVVAEMNIGGEFLDDEKLARLEVIAQRRWYRHFDNRLGLSEDEMKLCANQQDVQLPVEESLLADRPEHIIPRENFDHEAYASQGFKLEVPEHLYNRGEVYNLGIQRGTLTKEDRFKINEHIIMTIRMLEQLPLPDDLRRVPEYAGTHHETMIGTGYPRQLTRDELSVPSRIMALADIFEALTASDRPYKRGKRLSEALQIMVYMCKDEHIDSEVFRLFLISGVYLEYCEEFLKPEQLDDVDINDYLAQL